MTDKYPAREEEALKTRGRAGKVSGQARCRGKVSRVHPTQDIHVESGAIRKEESRLHKPGTGQLSLHYKIVVVHQRSRGYL
eukprot:160524-Prymnesium_polylepis.1